MVKVTLSQGIFEYRVEYVYLGQTHENVTLIFYLIGCHRNKYLYSNPKIVLYWYYIDDCSDL